MSKYFGNFFGRTTAPEAQAEVTAPVEAAPQATSTYATRVVSAAGFVAKTGMGFVIPSTIGAPLVDASFEVAQGHAPEATTLNAIKAGGINLGLGLVLGAGLMFAAPAAATAGALAGTYLAVSFAATGVVASLKAGTRIMAAHEVEVNPAAEAVVEVAVSQETETEAEAEVASVVADLVTAVVEADLAGAAEHHEA